MAIQSDEAHIGGRGRLIFIGDREIALARTNEDAEAIVAALNGSTARDAAIRAEERARCERVVYRANFGTEVDRHLLVMAIRARASSAKPQPEPAKEA